MTTIVLEIVLTVIGGVIVGLAVAVRGHSWGKLRLAQWKCGTFPSRKTVIVALKRLGFSRLSGLCIWERRWPLVWYKPWRPEKVVFQISDTTVDGLVYSNKFPEIELFKMAWKHHKSKGPRDENS